MRLIKTPALSQKKILVIDKESKQGNDRTWCFWENKKGIFETIIHHQWDHVHFYSNYFSGLFNLSPYHYKMIRSKDFYQYVYQQCIDYPNITFKYGKVKAIVNEKDFATVHFEEEEIRAEFVFNSIVFTPPVVSKGKHYLLQHFKGFFIKSNTASFKKDIATLMDFRISQKHGTAFVYVLPFSENTALVEYTLFTKELLAEEEYTKEIKHYIKQYLQIDNFEIQEEEFGVIPMTNIEFSKDEKRVINLGTAGGQTKGSSGYTFQFIQKHSDIIIQKLLKNQLPMKKVNFLQKRFTFYDTTLLNILATHKYPSDKIFSILFKNNPIEKVFRFLDNESSLADDVGIMYSLPKRIFMKAALEEIFKK